MLKALDILFYTVLYLLIYANLFLFSYDMSCCCCIYVCTESLKKSLCVVCAKHRPTLK